MRAIVSKNPSLGLTGTTKLMWYAGFDVTRVDLLNPASAGLVSMKSGTAGGPCVVHSGEPSHSMTSPDHGSVALACTSGSVLKISGGVTNVGDVDSGGESHSMPSDTWSGVKGIPVLGSGLTTGTLAAAPPCVMR